VPDPVLSLRTFLDGEHDPASVPNLRQIIEGLSHDLSLCTTAQQREDLARQHSEDADSLERGVDYELQVGNDDHRLHYDTVAANPDNARCARWLSDALRDRDLSARLLALHPEPSITPQRLDELWPV
jgi:hypothetical protein